MLSAAAMGGGWTNLAMVEMPVWFETWLGEDERGRLAH
jgi:hypothetical protein